MDHKDVDCAFEKCMADRTETFRPSPSCFLNSISYVNASSTVINVEYFESIFLPTTSVIGIIFNLINIFVLSRIKYKSCFIRLLCFLAVFDTGVLLPGILHNIHVIRQLCSSQHGRDFLNEFYEQTLSKIINFLIRCDQWLMVAISLERFLGISYPLKFPAKYRKSGHFILPVLLITFLDVFMLFYSTNQFVLHTIPFIITPILILIFLNLKIILTLITVQDIAGSFKKKVRESALVLISVVVI